MFKLHQLKKNPFPKIAQSSVSGQTFNFHWPWLCAFLTTQTFLKYSEVPEVPLLAYSFTTVFFTQLSSSSRRKLHKRMNFSKRAVKTDTSVKADVTLSTDISCLMSVSYPSVFISVEDVNDRRIHVDENNCIDRYGWTQPTLSFKFWKKVIVIGPSGA